MTLQECLSRERLAPEDATTLVRRALRTIAMPIARLARPIMKQELFPWGSQYRSENGNAEKGDAGQWILPKMPLVLQRSNQQTITCDVGTIWITQGDTHDYVLNAGQSLALRPAGSVIVTAMSGSALVRCTQQKS